MDPFQNSGIFIPPNADVVQAIIDVKPITLDKKSVIILMITKFTEDQKCEAFDNILKFPETYRITIVEALFTSFIVFRCLVMDPFKDSGIFIPPTADAVQAIIDVKPITLDEKSVIIVMIMKFTEDQKCEAFHNVLKFPETYRMTVVEALFNSFKGQEDGEVRLIIFAHKIFGDAVSSDTRDENLITFIREHDIVNLLFTKYLRAPHPYNDIPGRVFLGCEMSEPEISKLMEKELGFSYESLFHISRYKSVVAHSTDL